MGKYIITAILCLFFRIALFSQNSIIDPLKESLQRADNDSIKVELLVELSQYLLNYDMILGKQYAEQALEIARSYNGKHEIAISLLNLGNYARKNQLVDHSFQYINQSKSMFEELSDDYYFKTAIRDLGQTHQVNGAHDIALEHFDEAIAFYEEHEYWLELGEALFYSALSHINSNDNLEVRKILVKSWEMYNKSESSYNQSLVLHLMGEVHLRLGQAPEALEHFMDGLKMADKNQNRLGQLKNRNGLGSLFAIESNLTYAKKYFMEGLEISKALGNQREYTGLLHNIAYTHILMEDLDAALRYYQEAIENNHENNLKCLLPYSNEGLAMVLEKQEKYEASLNFFKKALSFARDCQMNQNEVTILQGIGRIHFAQKNNQEAIKYLKMAQSIAEESNFKKPVKDVAFELFKIYKSLGNYKVALTYHEQYKMLEDSLFNDQNAKRIAEFTAETMFQREKEQLKAERALQEFQFEAELNRQKLYKNFMTIGLIVTLTLIAALGWSYYSKLNANKKLVQLNQEKNDLLSVVAHDLRSPLNNIMGIIPIIKNDATPLSATQNKFLELINDSTDRLKDMISRVLDVNAIESQMINLRKESCDLGEVVSLVAENFKGQAERKIITIQHQVQPKKFYALVDRNYLIQVMENLVSNAIKFTPEKKKIEITISKDHQMINISIIDEGPGISKEDQKMLFYRYKKLSAKPTAAESSTGLGLSIAKKYVEAMNGKIWFQSEVGKGTTFTVQFRAYIGKSQT